MCQQVNGRPNSEAAHMKDNYAATEKDELPIHLTGVNLKINHAE